MSDKDHWLTPSQIRSLDRACESLWTLGGVYQVGSTLIANGERARPPRDIDIRLLVEDETWALFEPSTWKMLSDYIGRALETETGITPIDFQVQSRTEANRDHPHRRSALGILTRIRRSETLQRHELRARTEANRGPLPIARRWPECLVSWPECEDGAYSPNCCRWPKSCSSVITCSICFDPILETEEMIENLPRHESCE